MSKIQISISVDDAHLDRIQDVAQNLRAAGMNVEQTLSSIGVISGSIHSDQLDCISQIKGVRHIEQQREFQIAPPDSDIQ